MITHANSSVEFIYVNYVAMQLNHNNSQYWNSLYIINCGDFLFTLDTIEHYWIKTVVAILLTSSQVTKRGDEMHEKEHGE